MSNNTNTLFWVITGAVIVLGIFLLVNGTSNETIGDINNKFSSMFKKDSNNLIIDNDKQNFSKEILEQYYSHVDNYESIKVNKESDFSFDASTGTITEYLGVDREVVIPFEIDGVPVKSISELKTYDNYIYASNCEAAFTPGNTLSQTLKERIINNGIYVDGVCQKRSYIEKLILPNTIEEIGTRAFQNNYYLKSVVLPDSIKKINDYAFSENFITDINLKDLTNLEYIGAGAFSENKLEGELIIPDCVTYLGVSAFSDNYITSVIISKNLTELLNNSFGSNSKLQYAVLRNPQTIISNTGSTDYIFRKTSSFILKVPEGATEWYRQYSSLSKYKIEEIAIND